MKTNRDRVGADAQEDLVMRNLNKIYQQQNLNPVTQSICFSGEEKQNILNQITEFSDAFSIDARDKDSRIASLFGLSRQGCPYSTRLLLNLFLKIINDPKIYNDEVALTNTIAGIFFLIDQLNKNMSFYHAFRAYALYQVRTIYIDKVPSRQSDARNFHCTFELYIELLVLQMCNEEIIKPGSSLFGYDLTDTSSTNKGDNQNAFMTEELLSSIEGKPNLQQAVKFIGGSLTLKKQVNALNKAQIIFRTCEPTNRFRLT